MGLFPLFFITIILFRTTFSEEILKVATSLNGTSNSIWLGYSKQDYSKKLQLNLKPYIFYKVYTKHILWDK